MIGFLKRWLATRNDIEDMQVQLDTIANAIQELQKQQLIRREAEREAIVKQPSEVIMSFEQVDNVKPRKLPAKPVVVDGPDKYLKMPTSDHYARMSVRTKGSIENQLIVMLEGKMRELGCADVVDFRRRVNADKASVCISGRTRSKRRSSRQKKTHTYGGDLRIYDKRTINNKGNYPEKTYSFRCIEERLLIMAYFDIHRVPYTTGRKQ